MVPLRSHESAASSRIAFVLYIASDQTHAEASAHLAADDQMLYTMITIYIDDDWAIQTIQHRGMQHQLGESTVRSGCRLDVKEPFIPESTLIYTFHRGMLLEPR